MIGIDADIQIPTRCGECFASQSTIYSPMICFIKGSVVSGAFDKPVWCPLCEMRERKITEKTSHTNYKTSTVWEIVE